MESLIKNLHPLEIRVLREIPLDKEISALFLVETLGYKVGQANHGLSWLLAKNLIQESNRTEKVFYELTELGQQWQGTGTVEERIFQLLQKESPLSIPSINEKLGLEQKDSGKAFGSLKKQGLLTMDAEGLISCAKNTLDGESVLFRTLLDRASLEALEESTLTPEEIAVVNIFAKRKGFASVPFKIADREYIFYTFKPEAEQVRALLFEKGITGEEIGQLTAEMIQKKTWKNKAFRSYSVQAPTQRPSLGRRNSYNEYLQSVKDKLVSLGFEEMDGSLIETEFWNGDALYMPQFHPARSEHDIYYLKNPKQAKSIEEPFFSQVKAAHEGTSTTLGSKGWKYKFDPEFAKNLVLRTQGTALSSKKLPFAKNPGKYFGIARCFRYDQVDATHGADFYQTEGIVLGDDVNFQTLLGLLKIFAEEVAGAKEVKYVPSYFPFTEPSIEIHVNHPVLGWIELGGAGIFRSEVSQSLGIDVPVIAWGLGIDRMALMHLGLSDIRELFTHDIEKVRLRTGK